MMGFFYMKQIQIQTENVYLLRVKPITGFTVP